MTDPTHVPPFVSVNELQSLPGRVILADVRWYLDGSSGRAAYESGHLPGAVFVDLDRWLAAEPSPEAGRHPLPSAAVFSQGMRSAGISDADTVVAYDDQGGVMAARLVWMLRVTGRRAAVLDGGLDAYLDAHPGSLTHDEPAALDGDFSERPWPADELASIDEMTQPQVIAIDARNRDRFVGENEPVDPQPGHVPGARNVPCRGNLDASGRLLPFEDIRQAFAGAGVDSGNAAQVVSYCGSGVTACHNLLAMEQAGLGRGRLFVGGWSAYSSDPSRPVATGP